MFMQASVAKPRKKVLVINFLLLFCIKMKTTDFNQSRRHIEFNSDENEVVRWQALYKGPKITCCIFTTFKTVSGVCLPFSERCLVSNQYVFK